jgi:hypothetical protein
MTESIDEYLARGGVIDKLLPVESPKPMSARGGSRVVEPGADRYGRSNRGKGKARFNQRTTIWGKK